MVKVKCKKCKVIFYSKPSLIKRGWGVYCSRKCQYDGFRNGKIVNCDVCKKITYRNKQQLQRSKSNKFFCSKSCQTKWRNIQYTGNRHLAWKNGFSIYRSQLLKSGSPIFCKRCNESDFRILAAHHIDENHFNNELENLAWLCHNCHHLIHKIKEEKQNFLNMIKK